MSGLAPSPVHPRGGVPTSNPVGDAAALSSCSQRASDQTHSNEVSNAMRKTTATSLQLPSSHTNKIYPSLEKTD